ncbi:MAG: oxygen-independent coproporphyrinogen III oxidase [Bdellovibrionaceae bacterium]|nr:oxygen-independent coproporphyrinogen III oxidase [Bdellovibrionales bacterium]MCB9085658.1 oxygen-independent coproporphyrinogen III oxidase [Pseudobdellovibrionaceae bacterium]
MKYSDLLEKYDVPAPRYTSYPTVPYWSDSPTTDQWIEALRQGFQQGEQVPWSLYIHTPFCESLCTFCGCNTSITKNHDKEMPYVAHILREFELYMEKVPEFANHPLKEIHLGGGSPTWFSAESLKQMVGPILKRVKISADEFDGAIEVDPRRATPEQLRTLFDLGFRRISLGIQDFNPETQRLVNRIQPYELTKSVNDMARELGYTSVNFDLIYGLPMQTPDSVRDMANKTLELRPDRIALYSFAKVPWIKPAQRLFKDEDLPEGPAKRDLYETAREVLISGGYIEIGMDHFALETDGLAVAQAKGELHRNFMGYTDKRTKILLGLGVSSISEAPTCFHQNEKVLPVYERQVDGGEIPTFRGHLLSSEDQKQREQILEFMTKGKVRLHDVDQEKDVRDFLAPLIEDQIVAVTSGMMELTPKGFPFLRNVCMALDLRLRREKPETKVFSQAL